MKEKNEELDHIFSLMSYAVVFSDFQTKKDLYNSRGFNIGSVITNNKNEVVSHAVNSINKLKDESQHGEVRIITNYLRKTKIFNLKGHTLYTTLEPCAMCAGMMVMTELTRTVFGQSEKGISSDNTQNFGETLPRLATKTEKFLPYPRVTICDKSTDNITIEIDNAYDKFREEKKLYAVEDFLISNEAKILFQKATDIFLNYNIQNEKSVLPYKYALKYYNKKIQKSLFFLNYFTIN